MTGVIHKRIQNENNVTEQHSPNSVYYYVVYEHYPILINTSDEKSIKSHLIDE